MSAIATQVDLAGDTMVACSMSSTGEALAFGGSGGYVHLWALSHHPSVNAYSQVRPAIRKTCSLTNHSDLELWPLGSLKVTSRTCGVTQPCMLAYRTLSRRCRMQSLEVPAALPEPAVRLAERDSFAAAETFYPDEVPRLPPHHSCHACTALSKQ